MISFLLLDFFQILVFLVILYKHPLKDGLDHYLMMILICGAAAIFSKVVYYAIDPKQDLRHTISSTMCFCPMSYLFIRELLSEKIISKKLIIIHLIPFALTIFFFVFELTRPLLSITWSTTIFQLLNPVQNNMRAVAILYFLVLDLSLLYRYRSRLSKHVQSINFSIVIYFVIHKFLMLFLSGIMVIEDRIGSFFLHVGLLSMPLLFAVVIYYKVLLGTKHTMADYNQKIKRYLAEEPNKKVKKYAKSNVDDAKYVQLVGIISTYMEKHKPYLDMDFSMGSFAEYLQVSQHELSMVLNSKLQTTFYEYINKQRISYFISHFYKVRQEKCTIIGLAYESGFSSKSTFNKYFRKMMSISPTDYIKQQVEPGPLLFRLAQKQ